ncbi:unnamed protein product [Caretta caretta]
MEKWTRDTKYRSASKFTVRWLEGSLEGCEHSWRSQLFKKKKYMKQDRNEALELQKREGRKRYILGSQSSCQLPIAKEVRQLRLT